MFLKLNLKDADITTSPDFKIYVDLLIDVYKLVPVNI